MPKIAIGIVYAISRISGETMKNSIKVSLSHKNIICPILTHEHPKESYMEAKNMPDLARIMFSSICEMEKKLDEESRILIAVSANSVHRAFPELRSLLGSAAFSDRVHLLSMIDSTVSACKQNGLNKVLVLASSKTIFSCLYHSPLRENGIDPIDLPPHDLELMNSFIDRGIASLAELEVSALVDIITQRISETQCDGVLFGCAELKHKFSRGNLRSTIIDSADSLEEDLINNVTESYRQESSVPSDQSELDRHTDNSKSAPCEATSLRQKHGYPSALKDEVLEQLRNVNLGSNDRNHRL